MSGESGWVTTEVAAAALRVSPRTVRDYVRAGDLLAKSEGEGVRKRWLVSIDAVQEMRSRRQSSGYMPRGRHGTAVGEYRPGEGVVDAAELVARLQELQYRLGRAEARAELQAVAESTVREERDRLVAQLGEERARARAERDRADRLEAELREVRQPAPGPREPSETPPDEPSGTQAPPGDTEQPRRSWLYRVFFGP